MLASNGSESSSPGPFYLPTDSPRRNRPRKGGGRVAPLGLTRSSYSFKAASLAFSKLAMPFSPS